MKRASGLADLDDGVGDELVGGQWEIARRGPHPRAAGRVILRAVALAEPAVVIALVKIDRAYKLYRQSNFTNLGVRRNVALLRSAGRNAPSNEAYSRRQGQLKGRVTPARLATNRRVRARCIVGFRPETATKYHSVATDDLRGRLAGRRAVGAARSDRRSCASVARLRRLAAHRARPRPRFLGHGHDDRGAHEHLAQPRSGAPRDNRAVRLYAQPDLPRKHLADVRDRTLRGKRCGSCPWLFAPPSWSKIWPFGVRKRISPCGSARNGRLMRRARRAG